MVSPQGGASWTCHPKISELESIVTRELKTEIAKPRYKQKLVRSRERMPGKWETGTRRNRILICIGVKIANRYPFSQIAQATFRIP